MTPLDLWLYGTLAATGDQAGERVRLEWTDDARRRWGVGSKVLSHLLAVDTTEGTV